MKKQEFLEKIIGYLPYGLKSKEGLSIIGFDDNNWYFNCNINGEISTAGRSRDMLIVQLNPLSKLTEEITVDGETFIPMEKLGYLFRLNIGEYCWIEQNLPTNAKHIIGTLRYEVIVQLYKWHFDIHNLIDQGLAVEKK